VSGHGSETASGAAVPPVEAFGMDLAVAMRKRRMHRAFQERPVATVDLARLVWAAGRAPTARAGTRQLLVTSRPPLVRLVREACPGFINDAPTIILIFTDLARAEALVGERGRELIARIDAGAAAAYLSLAAPALGLGLCITTSWTEAAVQEIFELPDRCRPEVLIGVGYIASTPSPTVKARAPIVYDSTYGQVWRRGT
jgi:nitroreductase